MNTLLFNAKSTIVTTAITIAAVSIAKINQLKKESIMRCVNTTLTAPNEIAAANTFITIACIAFLTGRNKTYLLQNIILTETASINNFLNRISKTHRRPTMRLNSLFVVKEFNSFY